MALKNGHTGLPSVEENTWRTLYMKLPPIFQHCETNWPSHVVHTNNCSKNEPVAHNLDMRIELFITKKQNWSVGTAFVSTVVKIICFLSLFHPATEARYSTSIVQSLQCPPTWNITAHEKMHGLVCSTVGETRWFDASGFPPVPCAFCTN